MPRTLTLPNAMFLTIDDDVRDWFVKIINAQDFIQSMVPNKKFTLVNLEGKEFLNMCNVKNSTCDPFILIEAISIVRKMELYD